MTIIDEYSRAIRSSNLRSEATDDRGDPEVLGAMGLGDKWLTQGFDPFGNKFKPSPLAAPLTRLFLGDNGAADEIVRMLADEAWRYARRLGVRMARAQSEDLARACLAWHRDGKCKPCGGHGVLKIPGTTSLGTNSCGACKGIGTVPFEKDIQPAEFRAVGAWLVSEMQRASGKAGPEAMKALAPKLDL